MTIANVSRVSPDSVTVSVSDAARRHLLAGVIVTFSIATADTASAATIAGRGLHSFTFQLNVSAF